jgi:cytochrome c-type biogenesis protein CcmF
MVRALVPPAIGGVVVMALGLALGARNPWTVVALFFGGYAAQVTLKEMWLPMMQRLKRGAGLGEALVETQLRRGRRRFASYFVHSGVVIIIVSIAVSSTMQQSVEVQLRQGEAASIGDYSLTFVGVETVTLPHREAVQARLSVTRNGKPSGEMAPAMNYYQMSRDPIGTPDVRTTLTHDLYISVMNIDPQRQTVGLHLIINPMVGWIWIATGMMAAGGLFALIPARRRESVLAESVAGAEAAVES